MSETTEKRFKKKKEIKLDTVVFDRVPPHNVDAEIGVIGSILLDPLVCDDVTMILRADDFYSERNRTLFRHLQEMHSTGSGIDITLLIERLNKSEELETIGGHAYLGEIATAVQIPAHAVFYAEIVRDKAILRDLIHTSSAILHDAYDSSAAPREIISKAEERIFAINDARSSAKVDSMQDIITETLHLLNLQAENGVVEGVMTGLSELDRMTSGFHANELIILAARPSMGKTALATNIAVHAAVDCGKSILMVSLEMSKIELAKRMICSRGRIDGELLKRGFMSAQDRGKLMRTSSELGIAPMFIDDNPSRTVTEIGAVARRMKRLQGLDMIVIDYLTLIEPDNASDPRQEQVAKIARRLKGLARELAVPILCLAQLNRQAEVTKDNRPRLSHLRESGAIEQDADVVMFVHREEYYQTKGTDEYEKCAGQAEIIIAKQRNGSVGPVKVAWRSEYTLFENLADPHQEAYVEFGASMDENVF